MKKAQQNRLLTGAIILTISGFMISCTKAVPYKEEFKEQVHAKSEIDDKAEYIYVPTSDLSNHDKVNASGAIPFWQGQERIVKFRFTESTLQAVQVNEEARLKDNTTNEKVVMEIPIEHVDFRCAKDRYQKCTNAEEENKEITWNKKTKFKPNFDGMKTLGINLLPVEMEQVFGMSCYQEKSSRFLSYTMTADALNIQVEKVFEGDLACLDKMGVQIASLSDLQSQIIYHYSFTKMNTLASPGYKGLVYSSGDETQYGFFTTENRKYDVTYNNTERSKIQYMNRWNPAKKQIEYYLSDNFDKPEFAYLKKITQIGFDRINAGLKSAGLDTQLVLKGTGHKSPGDARNNMMVLVEDPAGGGTLGYGPSVANPRTGEILSARVALYHGNMLTGIMSTYDEVVNNLRNNESGHKALGKQVRLADDMQKAHMAPALLAATQEEEQAAQNSGRKVMSHVRELKARKAARTTSTRPAAQSSAIKQALNLSAKDLHTMTPKQIARALLRTDKSSVAKDALSARSKYCNYPSELFPFNDAVTKGLQSKLGEDLKYWKDLTEDEKTTVVQLIMPEVWIFTVVHELGHNLGLRHNFGGSEDKDNFYSAEELHKLGVTHRVPFASVMDYPAGDLNTLPTLGKYDIAALRFGYRREVEAKNGTMVKLADNQTIKQLTSMDTALADLKEYNYCSDEHVEVNPNCKRFDEGTTPTEILAFMEKSYEDLYSMRNFRNGRESFSMMSDAAYANRLRSNFGYIRAFMERYESMKYRFKLTDDAPEWMGIPFAKEVKMTAIKSGQFFLKVLQTPDVHCAIAKKDNLHQIEQVVELSLINPEAMSCFDKDIEPKPGYKIIGQAGKSFNHKKDPESENNYMDQIDVRGIYLDKIVAAEKIFKRKIGNSAYDANEDNYVDIPELFGPVMLATRDMLLNQSTPQMEFKDERGIVLGTFKLPSRVFSAPQDNNKIALAHWVEAPMDQDIAKSLGVPMRQASFQEILLNIIVKATTQSQARAADDRDVLDMFTVVRTNKSFQLDSKLSAPTRDIGVTRLVALKDNAFATMSIKTANLWDTLKKLDNEEIAKLYAYAKAKEDRRKAAANAPVVPSSFDKSFLAIKSADILEFSKLKGEPAADKVATFDMLKKLSDDDLSKLYNEVKVAEEKDQDAKAKDELAKSGFSPDLLDIESADILAYTKDTLDGPLNAYLATILPASNPQ